MKSSTSWPSWSRKYSATVSPVRATRARAPGGSFICPYTRATLEVLSLREMTPPSIISYYSKHRVTSVGLGDVVNQFHDQHSFADTSSTEETNLTSLGVGSEQVHHLDTGDQDLLLDTHVLESRSFSVDSLALVGVNGTPLVNWISNNIDNTSKGFRTHRDHDGVASVVDNIATDKTFSTVHSNGSDGVLSQVLGNLQDKLGGPVLDHQGIENLRKAIFELHINNSTNDRDNLALGEGRGSRRAH